jgi:hypothetical protein
MPSIVRITTNSGPRVWVEFQPTPAALLVIRSVSQRQFHPRKRAWSIPRRHLTSAIEEFAQMGFTVALDGQAQTGHGTNPFGLLQASMDPYLWRQVSSALLDLLDPGAGGDERLSTLLKRTMKVGFDQQRRPA